MDYLNYSMKRAFKVKNGKFIKLNNEKQKRLQKLDFTELENAKFQETAEMIRGQLQDEEAHKGFLTLSSFIFLQ